MTRRTVVVVERRARRVCFRPADAAFLRTHFPNVLDVAPGGGADQYRLTARGVVGTLDAPHCRVTIRPKLPWPNLRALFGLDPTGFAASTPVPPDADLLAVLAHEFAERLRALDLVRGYREADHVADALRGRLRTADQLRDAAARAFPGVFHVTESVFDLDTPWNRIPKAVAEALLAHPGLPAGARAAVASAAAALDGVTVVAPTDDQFDAVAKEPRAGAYDGLLALCRTLRDGLAAAAGAPGGGAFLVDLGRAFERAVHASLAEKLARVPGWSAEAQPGFAVGGLTLRPDVVVRRGGAARWVLDAKWKRPGPDPADLHQVLAYATVAGVRRVGLVYPGSRFAVRTLRAGPVTVALIRVPVAGPDPAGGWERLARRVRRADEG